MRVTFDSLKCGSAFDLTAHTPRRLDLGSAASRAGAVVQLTELDEVLFLPNVLEAGQSLCIAKGDVVPVESILDCWSVDFFRERKRQPSYAATYAGDLAPDRMTLPVCVLGNLFSRNFGHWTEELLKVAVLERAGVECRFVIPTMPAFVLDWLKLLGIDRSRIHVVDEPTIFSRAIFTSAVSHQNIADYPQVLFLFRDLVRSAAAESRSRFGRRLWLERNQPPNGGATLNREDVYRTLEPYGFDVVDMSTLSAAEQVAADHAATVIAGPHGSQFVHAQLMPESSTVVECFSPGHVNPSILQICRVLGHDYRQVVGRSHVIEPHAHGRDYVIDCEHLRLVLDGLTE